MSCELEDRTILLFVASLAQSEPTCLLLEMFETLRNYNISCISESQHDYYKTLQITCDPLLENRPRVRVGKSSTQSKMEAFLQVQTFIVFEKYTISVADYMTIMVLKVSPLK